MFFVVEKVKCIRFGSGGGQENINAICILGLNMINDKVISIYFYHAL